MNNWLYSYQHLPERLDPVAFSVFGLPVDWYSLMYLAGFLAAYLLLRYRIKKGEACHPRVCGDPVSGPKVSALDSRLRGNDKRKEIQNKIPDTEILLDLMLAAFGGLLIGGRLGYVLFYNFSYYAAHPLEIISPFDPVTHQFIGIFGMSYHGALIGALLAGALFVKIKKLNFWQWANFVAPAVPAGYFFGRLGNFMNGELYGRATNVFWGMYFPLDPYGLLRHPSELYEAVLEGLLLFLVLWPLRNHPKIKNNMLALYIIGYALARIVVEFFRQPDEQIGYLFGFLTLGQVLSFFMLIFGTVLMIARRKTGKMI